MNRNVMIVDDEPSVLRTVTGVLARHGFDVVGVAGGEACLARLRSGFRGVILMDVEMPGMDGWDTIRAIVEQGLLDGNAICMLTGNTEPEKRGAPVETYVLDYLTKPFESADLVAMVNAAMPYTTP